MKPLEAAAKAIYDHRFFNNPFCTDEFARAAILAFLRAAMDDEELCLNIGTQPMRYTLQALIDDLEGK